MTLHKERRPDLDTEMMRETAAMLLLGTEAVYDFVHRRILLLPVLAAMIIGTGILIWEGTWSVEYLAGFGIGGIMIALSVISRGEIGTGDGLILIALSSLFTWERILGDILTGLFLSSLAALYLIVVRHKGKKTAIPFIPFLFAGHSIILILAGWEGV